MNSNFLSGPGTAPRATIWSSGGDSACRGFAPIRGFGGLRTLSRRLAWLLTLVVTPAMPAAVLTFDGNICSALADGSGPVTPCASGGAYINQAYGDTATINFTYLSPPSTFSLQVWRAVDNVAQFQYSDLSDVAFGTFGTAMLSITLQPLAG